MTKDKYYEMCEALGSKPIESEVPVEFEDFPFEIQQCIEVYIMLQDNWDQMNGTYLGKNYTGFSEILDMLEIEQKDKKFIYEITRKIDTIRAKIINGKKSSQSKKPPK